jgi:hypothetical protein
MPKTISDHNDEPHPYEDELLTEELEATEFAALRGRADGHDGSPDPDSDWASTVIATAADAVSSRIAAMDDERLVSSLPLLRRLGSLANARELAVTRELIARRRPAKWDTGTEEVSGIPREATEEVALALTLTRYAAQTQTQLAKDVADRCPVTFAAHLSGDLDAARVKVIAEATSLLDEDVAWEIDKQIAGKAAGMTTGKLRAELRKLEIKASPDAAEERRERAERRARVRLYADSDFTATLCGESLPAELAAAAYARIAAIAAALKAAGAKGPAGLLQSKVYLGLLLGTLQHVPPPAPDDGPADGGSAGDGPTGGDEPDGEVHQDAEDREAAEVQQDSEVREEWPKLPGSAAAAAAGCAGLPTWLTVKEQRLKLTVAWRTLAGTGPEPGELCWLGPITPAQSRALATAAATDPATGWTVVVTDDAGIATTVTTLAGRKIARTKFSTAPGMIGEATIAIPASLARELQQAGWAPADDTDEHLARLLSAVISAAVTATRAAEVRRAADRAAGGCAHAMEVPGYRIPGRVRRWVNTRDRTCFNPICRQPAWRTDQDHTLAYDKGGRSCPCNLGPGCRADHQLKQLPGWKLTQTRPGHFTLTTRAGLSYTKTPDPYPT